MKRFFICFVFAQNLDVASAVACGRCQLGECAKP